MSEYIKISTVADLKKAVSAAKHIFVQVRFGCSEKWVKISKQDARTLVSGLPDDATPQDAEMSGEAFGEHSRNGNILYLS